MKVEERVYGRCVGFESNNCFGLKKEISNYIEETDDYSILPYKKLVDCNVNKKSIKNVKDPLEIGFIDRDILNSIESRLCRGDHLRNILKRRGIVDDLHDYIEEYIADEDDSDFVFVMNTFEFLLRECPDKNAFMREVLNWSKEFERIRLVKGNGFSPRFYFIDGCNKVTSQFSFKKIFLSPYEVYDIFLPTDFDFDLHCGRIRSLEEEKDV